MIIDALRTHLLNLGFSDVYINRVPETVSGAIMLESGGQLQQDRYVDVRRELVDVVVVNKSTELAYDTAFNLYRNLHTADNISIGRYYVYLIAATSIVFDGSTLDDRAQYRFTVEVTYRDTNYIIS